MIFRVNSFSNFRRDFKEVSYDIVDLYGTLTWWLDYLPVARGTIETVASEDIAIESLCNGLDFPDTRSTPMIWYLCGQRMCLARQLFQILSFVRLLIYDFAMRARASSPRLFFPGPDCLILFTQSQSVAYKLRFIVLAKKNSIRCRNSNQLIQFSQIL